MKTLLSSVLVAVALVACGPNNVATTSEGSDELGFEVDALTGELKAAVPSLTVWLRPQLTAEVRDGRQVFVLRGRASQNLEGVNSFVFDDPMGFANMLSARTFEVVFDANSELNSVAAGIRLFLAVRPANTAVAPATAALTLQPSFMAPSGSTSVFVRGDVWPLAIGDALTYRAIVRTTGGAPLVATTSKGDLVPVSKRDADEWNVDFSFTQLRDAGKVTFTATTATGPKVKTATLGVAVKTFALTRGDVESVFPPLQCSATVQACLNALPAGSLDSESCGTWYPVTRCSLPWRRVEMISSPDDLTALVQARDAVNAQLPSTKQVSFRAYATLDRVPLSQVSKVWLGWRAKEGVTDLVDVGDATETQVKAALKAFGNAEPMVPAAQKVVYQQSFVARRYVRGQSGVVYALYFSNAARLVLIETNELLP